MKKIFFPFLILLLFFQYAMATTDDSAREWGVKLVDPYGPYVKPAVVEIPSEYYAFHCRTENEFYQYKNGSWERVWNNLWAESTCVVKNERWCASIGPSYTFDVAEYYKDYRHNDPKNTKTHIIGKLSGRFKAVVVYYKDEKCLTREVKELEFDAP